MVFFFVLYIPAAEFYHEAEVIEIIIKPEGQRLLCIHVDAEGLGYLLSSVRFVAARQMDVMYTAEEWGGELSVRTIPPGEGFFCSRFDFWPDESHGDDFSCIVFRDEGGGCCVAGIIASSAWFHGFAHKLESLQYSSGQNGCLEMASALKDAQKRMCIIVTKSESR